MIRFSLRPLLALCAVAAAFVLIAASDADARAGRGGSFGSRGAQSFKPAPPTNTAPKATAPLERSMSQPAGGSPAAAAARPGASPAGGILGRPGFMGGLFAGFLGAGLLGLLFGHGLTGGLGGLASMLGLLLQVGIVALIAYLLWTWWQRRNQPAMAGGPALRDMPSDNARPIMGLGSFGGAGNAQPAARAAGTDEVGLTPDDFNTFERLLGEVQTAYGQEDLNVLRSLATPEMVTYFSEDLAENFEQRPGRQDFRREASAGRPVGSLAREHDRLRHRRVAVLAQRPAGRTHERPRGRRRAGRGHRSVDLHAHARRQMAALGDPAAILTRSTPSGMI